MSQRSTARVGSSAFQLECLSGGMMINTWWFPHGLNPAGAGPHAVFEYKWTIPAATPLTPGLDPGARARNPTTVAPWRTETSDLVVQASLRAAWFLPADRGDVPGSPVAQLSLVVVVIDRTSGEQIPFVVLAYDDRPGELFAEAVGCDASVSPCTPFVSTRFLDDVPDPDTGLPRPGRRPARRRRAGQPLVRRLVLRARRLRGALSSRPAESGAAGRAAPVVRACAATPSTWWCPPGSRGGCARGPRG